MLLVQKAKSTANVFFPIWLCNSSFLGALENGFHVLKSILAVNPRQTESLILLLGVPNKR